MVDAKLTTFPKPVDRLLLLVIYNFFFFYICSVWFPKFPSFSCNWIASLPHSILCNCFLPAAFSKDIANFHRPKALWYPHDSEMAVKEQGKLPTQGPMKVIVKSLGGKGSKLHVDAEETVYSIKAKASKKLGCHFSLTHIYHSICVVLIK